MKRDFKNDLFCVLFTSFVNEKVASGLKIVEMETEIDMICIWCLEKKQIWITPTA